jgi:tetratricopeptide (TPR) repeat protein
VGLPIVLTDFQLEELDSFHAILDEVYPGEGAQILAWALAWTGGQPYLTQKLCAALVENPGSEISSREIDALVTQLFLGDQARTESNLRAIRDRIFNSPHKLEMLRIYRDLLRDKTVLDEERSLAKNELKLTGLVRADTAGNLRISNRIYRQVYDHAWVKENLPTSRAQRVAVIASVVAVIALLIAAYVIYHQNNQTAQTYIEQFESSASADVRLTSLARLLELGDEAAGQAKDLFWEMPQDEKFTLFNELSNPQNLADELVTMISAVYQNIEDTAQGNALLTAMEQALNQVSFAGAPSLRTEIAFWVKGRQAAGEGGNPEIAISYFDSAWGESIDRDQPNSRIRFERGLAHATLGGYETALIDFEVALKLDEAHLPAIIAYINQNTDMGIYWAQNSEQFPDLSAAISPQIATQPPTSTATETATLAPTTTAAPTETSIPEATFTPVVTYTLDIAFASDRDGEFGVYLMAAKNPATWEALPRPTDYERVWWPSFCGNRLLAEAQDLDGYQPQWLYFLEAGYPEVVRWNVHPEAASLGVPRCTHDLDYIAYSAYIPQDYDDWTLMITDNRERTDYVITGTNTLPAPGYLSWTRDGSTFLAMVKRNEKFYIERTAKFPANLEPEEIIRGKYPAISPDGSRVVYLCAEQLYLCLMDLEPEKIIFLAEVKHTKVRGETIPLTAMWSSDSQWVYFSSAPEGNWDIFRVHPDGSNLQNLTRVWGDSNEIMPVLKWEE